MHRLFTIVCIFYSIGHRCFGIEDISKVAYENTSPVTFSCRTRLYGDIYVWKIDDRTLNVTDDRYELSSSLIKVGNRNYYLHELTINNLRLLDTNVYGCAISNIVRRRFVLIVLPLDDGVYNRIVSVDKINTDGRIVLMPTLNHRVFTGNCNITTWLYSTNDMQHHDLISVNDRIIRKYVFKVKLCKNSVLFTLPIVGTYTFTGICGEEYINGNYVFE